MLTPGETVINEKSSRSFFSQLQAINAGVQPSFNSSSTVRGGDFHINEAGIAKDTAWQVMDQISRETRRGPG